MYSSYSKISEEIHGKLEEQQALAEELGIVDPRQRDPETEIMMRELAEATKAKGELEGKLAEVQTNYMVLEQQLKDPAAIDRDRRRATRRRSEHEHDEPGADGAAVSAQHANRHR